jgi:hypothetical protein
MPDSDVIFILGAGEQLERIPYTPYSSEEVLQHLIASYPDLLAGEQINPDAPPRWLLVSREAGIPDQEGVSDRWAADHLLLDQRSVPTFVEVKRSTDTRIRREVIGQMLDYAANATRYWPADRLRSLAAEQSGGVSELDRTVQNLVGSSAEDAESVEMFWTAVEENLRSGPLRLLFVADEIPRELRRVIEFLNEHMPRIEVLGLEVRQYAQGSLRALVPRVIGQTERARKVPSLGTSPKQTSEAEFLGQCPAWSRSFFQDILRDARAHNLLVRWGTKGFSIRGTHATGRGLSLLYGYPAGAAGNAIPFLEVYLKDVGDVIDTSALRHSLISAAGFREGGQYTLRAILSETSLEQARAGLPAIWKAYRDVQSA